MRVLARSFGALAWWHALGRLRRDWGYALIGVLSLSLGAVLVALSLAWLLEVVWRSDAYPESHKLWQLQIIDEGTADSADHSFGSLVQVSGHVVREFAARQDAFTRLGMGQPLTFALGRGARRERVSAFAGDATLFELLGVSPALGRMPSRQRQEVLLTESFAKAQFGSATAALGQVVTLDAIDYRVVGTLPGSFVHPAPPEYRRSPGALPQVYLGEQVPTAADASSGIERLVIGRSELAPRELRASVIGALAKIASLTGGSAATPILRPLNDWVAGDEAAMAGRLLVLTCMLLFTVLVTAAGSTTIRARMQSGERALLEVLGAAGGRSFRFISDEVNWIALGTFLVGTALFCLVGYLAQFNPELGVPVTWRFFAVGMAILWGECVLTLVFLQLLVRRQARAAGAPGNSRGADRLRAGRGMLRAVVTMQAIISLVLLGLALHSSTYSIATMRDALLLDAADLYEVRIQRQGANSAQWVATEARRIRQAAAAHPGIARTALLSSPPLDLFGFGFKYSGPREVIGRVVSRRGSEVIIASERARDSGASSVSYQASIIGAESAYFEMMGYPILAGRVYGDAEQNAAILTPDLGQVLFPQGDAVGSRVPASPQLEDGSAWHSGLVVKAVVDARRVGGASVLGRMFSQFPVAFVPYSDRLVSSADRSASVSLLLQSTLDAPAMRVWLDSVEHQLQADGYDARAFRLADQVRERAVTHFFASLLGFAIVSIVMFSAGLGAMGGIRQLCSSRRGEIAIRVAIGEPEHRVAIRLAQSELAWPIAAVSLLGLGWLLLSEALGLGPTPGVIGVAWALVVAVLILGVVPPLLGVLREAPARALQEE